MGKTGGNRKRNPEADAIQSKKIKVKKAKLQKLESKHTDSIKQKSVKFNIQNSPKHSKIKTSGIKSAESDLKTFSNSAENKPLHSNRDKKNISSKNENDTDNKKPLQKQGDGNKKKPFQKLCITDKRNSLGNKTKPGVKFQKKTFNNKKGATQKKPEDWNAFKKRKKELFLKRKQSKTLYDTIVKAKQIGEKLRLKNIEGGTEVKTKLVVELHELLKSNYVNFVLAHDMARIVQYLLKFGPENIRQEISQEIVPATVTMLQSKYGKSCVKWMLKYGNTVSRSACLRATYGHAVRLTSHAVSAPVHEYAYSTWASPIDKISLVQEFFGDMYKSSKDSEVKHLRDVWRNSADMKIAALGATKANLARILNKILLDSCLVQTVLCQFLEECSPEDRTEMIAQLAPHVVVLSNSKDGAAVVMQCIWHGTNKDRKVLMKALKEHALALSKHEFGHTTLIALFDNADDTVLLNKLILTDLLSHAHELALDEWGRKVLFWLVSPADKNHFHPSFLQYVDTGRKTSNTKKNSEIRRQELIKYCTPTLLKNVAENPKDWFDTASVAVFTLACIKNGSGTDLENTVNNLSKHITAVDWKVQENDIEIFGIESPGLHMTLKKLAQNDKLASENKKYTFGEAMVKSLTNETIEQWIAFNRGCFMLVNLFENGIESVQSSIKEIIFKHKKLLRKHASSGANILLKKIV